MTWSYGDDPLNDPRDAVRFRLGDTDADDPLLTDNQVDYCLSFGDVDVAAAHCCRSIVMSLAKLISKSVGPLSLQRNQRFEHYSKMCPDAGLGSGATTSLVITPALSASAMMHARDPQPIFTLHMHEGQDDITPVVGAEHRP